MKLLTEMCCIMLFLTGITSVVFGQKIEIPLQEQKLTIQMEKQALGTVFKYLMETYDIPIGFEESMLDRGRQDYRFLTNLPEKGTVTLVSDDGSSILEVTATEEFSAKEHPITVNFENVRLAEVFDEIVGQMANYEWMINNGVVNIFPSKGRDPRFKELLDTRIGSFELAEGNTVAGITAKIVGMKEFQKWKTANNLRFNPVRSGPTFLIDARYGRQLKGPVKLYDLSFRELLNKITKFKKGGWILKRKSLKENGDEHIDLDI